MILARILSPNFFLSSIVGFSPWISSRAINIYKLETFLIKHLFESKELEKHLLELPEKENNYSADDEEKNVPYAAGTSFHQSLKNQLSTYSFGDEERLIAEFLVGSIDDSGYIRRDILDLVDDLAFTANIFTTKEKVCTILKNVWPSIWLTRVSIYVL